MSNDHLPALVAAVDDLIERYGFDVVYNEVRGRPGRCQNCGGQLTNRHHDIGGLGWCYTEAKSP